MLYINFKISWLRKRGKKKCCGAHKFCAVLFCCEFCEFCSWWYPVPSQPVTKHSHIPLGHNRSAREVVVASFSRVSETGIARLHSGLAIASMYSEFNWNAVIYKFIFAELELTSTYWPEHRGYPLTAGSNRVVLFCARRIGGLPTSLNGCTREQARAP